MNWLHSCRRAAELLSQGLDEPLGLLDRLRLRMHLSMCNNCRRVDEQLDNLHALSADLFSDEPGREETEVARPARPKD
ncbi:MAG: zf-HC2 domain-containing protein [Burkholderiaceae bacterium]